MSNENPTPVVIDQFHKHEMMDRLHVLNTMFNELVRDHQVAAQMPTEVQALGDALWGAYQRAGAIAMPDNTGG